MKKVFLLLVVSSMSFSNVFSNDIEEDKRKHLETKIELEAVTVSANRATKNSAVAYTNLNQAQIQEDNAGKNIPMILQALPSVVSFTEGGTAVGNTAFRVRGTAANRINVTLNGMPLNNPESQEVYWVNLPDLSTSLQSVQMQRGVGTSTAGTSSFGASLSMQTTGSKANPYADIKTAFGSYNTIQTSASVGTGVLENGLSLDARFTYINSDGYIRNATADHKSAYVNLAHYTDKQMLRFIYMYGSQKTGITWEGVTEDQIKEYGRRYNPAGEYKDVDGKTLRYYDNQTDNYFSNIAQAIYSRFLSNEFTLNLNFGYNNGYGYYEEYKVGRKYSSFGLPNQEVDNITYKKSDVIRRKLMSNNLYSGGGSIQYNASNINVSLGGSYAYYEGKHYGKLLWVKHNQDIPKDYEWYRNKADKSEFNNFLKINYSPIKNLNLSGEVQGRFIDYKMNGIDDDLADLDVNLHYNFFNPKLGIDYTLFDKNNFFFSFAISNREPQRSDLKESTKNTATVKARPITSERLFDYELGYRYTADRLVLGANFYYMKYKDQLVETGRLSSTGYKYQENVKDSYRLGVELEALYSPLYWLSVGGNLTLSKNKIKDYSAYFDVYDNPTNYVLVGQKEVYLGTTDISFSPKVIGSAILKFKPLKREDLTFSFVGKYVGKMNYSNLSLTEHQQKAYFVTDFYVNYGKNINKIFKRIEAQFSINNLFSNKYVANGWASREYYQDGSHADYVGVYPQAPINVMGQIALSF